MPPAPLGDEALGAPRSRADLFVSFSLLALQGFGGVLAIVQRELVEKKRWLTREQFLEDWSVAQILPGPNIVNLSLMLGGRYFGPSGALAALAGMLVFPLIVALAMAVLFGTVSDSPAAQGALRGMGAVAAGLVTATGIKLVAALDRNPMGRAVCWSFAAATFVATAWLRWPLILVLLGLGSVACTWAWIRLGRQAGKPGA